MKYYLFGREYTLDGRRTVGSDAPRTLPWLISTRNEPFETESPVRRRSTQTNNVKA